jgi:hypothetical protein
MCVAASVATELIPATMKFKHDNRPPVTVTQLETFEAELGFTLPPSYREFLLHHNGGRPSLPRFYIPDCESYALVDDLMGVYREEAAIDIWMDELEEHRGRFLPIGLDSEGNLLLLEIESGKIYYWDSGRYFDDSTDEVNTYWVADDFGSFISGLTGR